MAVKFGGHKTDYSAMQGPAPSGFHVPSTTEWQAVYDIWTALGGGSSDGTNFGIALKLPFAGNRSYKNASVGYQGSYGYYWSSSPHPSYANYSYRLYFNSSSVHPQDYYYRAYGFSVRCFKDTPTIPTSSWTKLYGTSIEAGGIFWSSTDGLISLSSDGQTWVTIADKNLGATTVWNSGDTLSEANCGKYYQRGNNYGFAWTGTLTTSSTQVDATNYGPGNYYSSSTFIIRSSTPYGWDSSNNKDLRGGVTGIKPGDLRAAYIGEWYVAPTSITLNKSSISLTTVGQTEQLTATVLPAEARQTVTWTSNNTSIATVNQSGLVTCVTPGDATITATTVNGLTATCTVKSETVTTYSINLANSSTSSITSQGWTYGYGTPQFDSTGMYSSSAQKIAVYKRIDNLSSYNRIKITSTIHIVAGGWNGDLRAGIWSTNGNAAAYYKDFGGRQHCYNGSSWQGINITWLDSTKSTNSFNCPTGDYTHVFEMNLNTGVATFTISGTASGSTTYTATSSELTEVRACNLLGAGFEAASSGRGTSGNKVKTIKVDLYS